MSSGKQKYDLSYLQEYKYLNSFFRCFLVRNMIGSTYEKLKLKISHIKQIQRIRPQIKNGNFLFIYSFIF